MNVFVAAGSDEIGKFEGIVRVFPVWRGSVLDIGCRSRNLGRVLAEREVRYCGLDPHLPCDIRGTLDGGLPFHDEAFDTTVALDVLEHTDDLHGAFREVCRVTRYYSVISLPNAYVARNRVAFGLGRSLGAKYGLPVEKPRDRHRWLFSFAEASRFCATWAARCGFRILDDGGFVGPRRGWIVFRSVLMRFPNLFCPTYLVLLGRNGRV